VSPVAHGVAMFPLSFLVLVRGDGWWLSTVDMILLFAVICGYLSKYSMQSREMQSRERGHTGHARQQVTRHFLFVILLSTSTHPSFFDGEDGRQEKATMGTMGNMRRCAYAYSLPLASRSTPTRDYDLVDQPYANATANAT
jgi:hypothetical protein